MSQSLPSSLPPKPPTHSGATGYIIAAILLLIAIVALIYFKLRGSREAPAPLATAPAITTPTLAEPPPPPPPPAEPPAVVDAGNTVAAAGPYNPCPAKCSGTGNTALSTAI